MEQQMVLRTLQEIITPYLEEPCEINMDTHLIHDLMINSFDYTNIITDVEGALKINIDDLSMHRVKDLVQFIMQTDKKEG